MDLTKRSVNRRALLGLVDSLERAVRTLNWNPKGTEWAGYYQDTNYSSSGFEHKKRVVEEFLGKIRPKVAWDLGANVGTFSRIASGMGTLTIAFDIDPACVEQNYLQAVALEETNLLPLVSDLTNPSPGIGWENRERAALLERGPADAVMALALIHHLAISNNLPFAKAAHFFARAGRHLVIEYVPKTDSQVRRLLVTREDVFPGYTQEEFEKAFRDLFTIHSSVPVKDSERTLYWMERK